MYNSNVGGYVFLDLVCLWPNSFEVQALWVWSSISVDEPTTLNFDQTTVQNVWESVFNQTLISNCIYNKINIIAANISIIWESLKTSNQLAKFLRHIAGHLTTLLKFFFQNGLYFFQGTVTSIPPSGCLEVESRCYKCRRIYVCFQNFSTYYIII